MGLLAALVALAGSARGWAQGPSPAPAASTPPLASASAESPASIRLNALLADGIGRLALLDLRVNETPQPRDFEIAGALFKMAEKYAPNDADLVRRRVEAAGNAGDVAGLLDATRRLLELDPKDTVAALRLISTDKIARLQTAEERLAAYDRYTSEAAAKLDPSIRSRLALDAALLCQERGDHAGFVDRLKLAATLDSTNKDAALLLYNYVASRLEDPRPRVEALSNLLYADPADPNVHIRIARELARGGAFKASQRFHANASAIVRAGMPDPPMQLRIEHTVLEWMNNGAEPIFTSLKKSLESMRAAAARAIKEAEQELRDTTALTKPEDEHLPIGFEPLRLATAIALHERESAISSLGDIRARIKRNYEIARDPLLRPRDIAEEDLIREAQAQLFTLQLWRAATGLEVEKIAEEIEEARKGMDADDTNLLAFEAMYAARLGKPEEALAKVAGAAEVTEWTEFARAVALEAKGDLAGAVEAYRSACAQAPLTPQGGHCSVRADELARALEMDSSERERRQRIADLERLAATIPVWVDEMVKNPNSYQLLAFEVENPSAPVDERLKATLTIQNVSRIALGLGGGRTLNSRFLLSPALTVRGMNLREFVFPEVFDLERRLRLKPGEALTATLPLELGRTGWTLLSVSGAPCQMRWRAIQGFEVKDDGTRIAGPGCLEALSTGIVRTALTESRLSYGELAKRAATAIEADAPGLIIGSRSMLVAATRGVVEDEKRKELAAAWAARYPSLSARARMFLIVTMPPAGEMPELQAVDDAIRAEMDPEVLMLALLSRAAKADDALIQSALSSSDPGLARLATLHAERIGTGAAFYATKGSSLAESLGKFSNPEVTVPAKRTP